MISPNTLTIDGDSKHDTVNVKYSVDTNDDANSDP